MERMGESNGRDLSMLTTLAFFKSPVLCDTLTKVVCIEFTLILFANTKQHQITNFTLRILNAMSNTFEKIPTVQTQ